MFYREVGDSLGVVRAQGRLGEALFFLGRREEAQEVLEEALRLARQARIPLSPFPRHGACFELALSTGDVSAGRGYIAEELQIREALGQTSEIGHSLLALAVCEFRAGNVKLALEHATDALAIAPPDSYLRVCCA